MAGWLHGVFVVDWLFVFPLCGFSLSLFCNYCDCDLQKASGCLMSNHSAKMWFARGLQVKSTCVLLVVPN